jgi:metastasis-associated protein MTA
MTTDTGSTNTSGQQNELTDTQKHQLRHRELFLTRQNETLLATNIRGKCLVTLHNETEIFVSYLNSEVIQINNLVCLFIYLFEKDLFFYQLVYDPTQKTLNADRGEIRVGGKYQADVPIHPISNDGTEGIKKKR